jgi:hypothetical protein
LLLLIELDALIEYEALIAFNTYDELTAFNTYEAVTELAAIVANELEILIDAIDELIETDDVAAYDALTTEPINVPVNDPVYDPVLYAVDPVHAFNESIELVTAEIAVIVFSVTILFPFKNKVESKDPVPSVIVDALICNSCW